jgi:hypothetical protein
VILKGGFTLETSKYRITPKDRNIGMILSVKGIPYFELDFYEFRGNLDPMRRMCNIVVECDELFEIMDLARGDYRREDDRATAFERALKSAIAELLTRKEYRVYLENKRKEEQKKKSEELDNRKKALMSNKQRYVFVEGKEEPIHREPENEWDVLAIIWKLEGMNKTMFPYFKSLDHTSPRKGGIDIVAHIKEDEAGEINRFTSIEIENEFSSFKTHKHYPPQTSYIICWKVEDPDVLEKAKERYKYFKKINDHIVKVFVLSELPGIRVETFDWSEK